MPSRVNDPPLGRMSADVHARFIDPAYAHHAPAPKNRQTRNEGRPTSAIVDRVLERGRWITLDGSSGRTKHLKLDPAIPQDGPGARVSGNRYQNFRTPQS